MSLKRRLVAAMLLLLVAAVVTADVVTTSSLRSFLIGRLDEQIEVAQAQAYTYIYDLDRRAVADHEVLASTDPQAWLSQLAGARDPSCVSHGVAGLRSSAPAQPSGAGAADTAGGTPRLNASVLAARLNPDVYVEVITSGAKVVFDDPSGSCADPDPAPVLPAHLSVEKVPPSRVFGQKHGPYVPESVSFEVAAVGSSGPHYRAQAVAVPGGTLVTAVSLDPTNQTLASLAHVELGVSIAVVLALLLLVLWIVRFGLRPLEDMTRTAGAIAGGDLKRRIQRTDERSEVGRLGSALNGMLSQIEAAFRERGVSEARLRRFVADASHELRTPLTSIRGYAELLRKEAFSDEASRRRAAERIEHEAARMSVLVDDLLLLARLDQGRPLDRSPVDVAEVVGDAVEAARAVDPHRTISLDGSVDAFVEGDAVRLRQILDNLLRNALLHTPAGTPVHVRVGRTLDMVVISVSDEGPGLDTVEQARVFDRFYRGNEARTGGGTGLGLSIVAALARAHSGRAHVRSEPGRGATFVIELPAVEHDSGIPSALSDAASGPGAGSATVGGTKRVES
ncbi:MAG TPA: HAMP domain-containing sensor histidine kinase [Acidimicrobiales bacterium]|nr:HAMP domain-containing sensor histidine kinase [Acidimicrobiales bacterium]